MGMGLNENTKNKNSRRNNSSPVNSNKLRHIGNYSIPAYQGDDPYIFITYSHQDSDLVHSEIERFNNDGYNVWYDEGITSGKRWQEVVESALTKSSLLVVFVSDSAVESKNVRNEISLALEEEIPIIPIFLEECELKRGLQVLKLSPSILKYEMDEQDYVSHYRNEFEKYGFEFKEIVNDDLNVIDRIDKPPFHAYQGDEPYIFASYSHLDSELVFKDLERFYNDGYNVWYDEGITSGKRWQEVIEKALTKASLFVTFISKNAVESVNVRNEIFLAYDEEIDIIPIYLEETKLGHGLGLQLRSIQSIYKHQMSEEGYIEKYRKEFRAKGFEVKERTPTVVPIQSDEEIDGENETDELIELIENKISELDERDRNNYDQMIELYKGAVLNQNDKLLEFVKNGLKSMFTSIYVDVYIEKIKSAPDILQYPSLLLNIQSDSLRFEIIRATFFELENSLSNQNIANELIKQAYVQKDNEDIEGLEETVVQIYKELHDASSQGASSKKASSPYEVQEEMEGEIPKENIVQNQVKEDSIENIGPTINPADSIKPVADISPDDKIILDEDISSADDINPIDEVQAIGNLKGTDYDTEYLNEFEKLNTTTNSIFDLGENEVLIVLKDGTNLTSWDDVDDKEDILYLSEDLSDFTDLSDRYKDLKSLKAIVATNVTSNATDMEHMFNGCSSLVDISTLKDWNTINVTDMNAMFNGCSSLEDISPLKYWETGNVTDMNGMFDGCSSLRNIYPLKDWDTSNVSDISGIFYSCSSLIDTFALKNWDISNVKFMSRAFRGCSSLVDVSALKNWNIENISDMNGLFKGCSSLIDIFALKNWNMVNISDLSGLFYGCSSLEDISPLKNWKTKNVTDMCGMFQDCSSLADVSALKNWNVSNVTDMSEMFCDCSSLDDVLALKNWNTKKLKDTNGMFKNCSSLIDGSVLKNWDTDNLIYKSDMFDGCNNIKKLPKWYAKSKK